MKKKASIKTRDVLRREFYQSVAEVLQKARRNAYRAVNFTMVEALARVNILNNDGVYGV